MNRHSLRHASALAAMLGLLRGARRQITDGNRTFKTQPDPERRRLARAKRDRKDRKRFYDQLACRANNYYPIWWRR